MWTSHDEQLILEHGYTNDYRDRKECEQLIGSLTFDSDVKDLPYPTTRTSSVQSFADIKHVLFTNYLNHRKQRVQTFDELKRLGFHPQCIETIKYNGLELGIICTHIKCLELAKTQQWNHVLICNENVTFRKDTAFIRKKVDQFLSRHSDWDVILFDGGFVNGTYLDDASARITKSLGDRAYLVHQDYYDILVHNFRQAARSVYHKQNNKLDIHWHSLQARDHWYTVLPLMVVPRPGSLPSDRNLPLISLLKKYCMNLAHFPEREQLRFNDYPFQFELDLRQYEPKAELENLLRPIVQQTIYQELDNSIPKRQTPLRCFQDIQNVLYINLDDRPDRRQEIELELTRVGLKPQRMTGFRIPGNGTKGCNMSHLKCLETAKSQGWDHVLICEDDALFRTDISFVQRQIDTFLQRHTDWDVITLGPNVRDGKYVDDCSARVYQTWCATAYIVRQEYYDVLLHLFKNATQADIIADSTWSHLSTRDHWYTVLPLLVVQRPSKSDLEDSNVDYRKLMIQNSFKHIRGYDPIEQAKYINAIF